MNFDLKPILAAFASHPEKVLSTQDLMHRLDLRSSERHDLVTTLKLLVAQGRLQRAAAHAWRLAPMRQRKSAAFTGRIQKTRRGFSFVRLDDEASVAAGSPDVMIPMGDEADALDGDRVVVEITGKSDKGPRGLVVEVLDRAHKRIVGIYQRSGPNRAFVMPRNVQLNRRIEVPWAPEAMGVKDLDWVDVEVTSFPMPPAALRGTVVERLGAENDAGIDVLLLLRDRGIVAEFPPSVEEAAGKLRLDVESELPRRQDLRKLPTFTIDPATAKDFDDAVSIEKLPGGKGWRLWVHIADVSHYVRPGDPIDREAVERGTSVYPVDRVVPMLPEVLSNDLCSLRPREDRLTMTAEMIVSPKGEVSQERVYSSIIHSNHRLTYEQAQAVFEGSPDALGEEIDDVRDHLMEVRDCARAMRKARLARGALDLDIPEMKILFHENGEVSHLGLATRFEAHMTIEDCMLAANEAVARIQSKASAPTLYRIHTAADMERLEKLQMTLRALGIHLPLGKGAALEHGALQGVLKSLENRRGGHILRRLVLRALQRACYSPHNAGHYGLASTHYCHFTSPIRRYPDVVVHRQLRALERNEPLLYPDSEAGIAELVELGAHCSAKEREAADAEYESIGIKSVEYLQQFEGDEFDGLVASVHNFGLFVELQPHGLEGLLPLSKIPGDHWEVDELGVEVVGARSGKAIRLTDEIRVRLAKAKPLQGMIDLEAVVPEGGFKGAHDQRRRTPQQKGGKGGPPQQQKGGKGGAAPSKKGGAPFYKKVARSNKGGKGR